MKIEKSNIRKSIENRINMGIVKGEEVDVTTEKIMQDLWPIIDYISIKSKTRKRL